VVFALGGIPEKKKDCSLMGVSGLRGALKDFLRKKKSQAGQDHEKSRS
jgi:NifU-like protein involved in Fe-S cluster formation